MFRLHTPQFLTHKQSLVSKIAESYLVSKIYAVFT